MQNYKILKNKKLFILDMDGTFYLGNKMFPFSMKFIDKLNEQKKEFMFFTNNSSKDSKTYVEKILKMGLKITRDDIMTSGDVTISYLLNEKPKKSVYLIGTPLLKKSFIESGIRLTEDNPDIVVLGFDTTLTYEKIDKGCYFIRNNAEFIATHPDVNCPAAHGFFPDCGAMIKMFKASTGVYPKILGKPNIETLNAVSKRKGISLNDMAFVGDRLETDVAIGVKNNVTGVLVLSGAADKRDVEQSDIKPDFIFDDLGCLADVL